MSVPQAVDTLPAMVSALLTALGNALPTRIVTRDFAPFEGLAQADLAQGVLMLVADGEAEYSEALGMRARQGTAGFVLVGYLRVEEDCAPSAIEDAELALMEEIKGFVRAGVTGLDVQLLRMQQSRQQYHPDGWVTAYLSVREPRTHVY